MPSTYTTQLGVEKVATGEQNNTWGATLDTGLDTIDAAFAWISLSQTQITTATAKVTFALPSKFNRFKMIWRDLALASSTSLSLNYSIDGGTTTLTDAVYQGTICVFGAAGLNIGQIVNQTAMQLSPPATIGGVAFGDFEFQTTSGKAGFGTCVGLQQIGGYYRCDTSSLISNSTTATHIILNTSGAVPFTGGSVKLLGMAN